MDETAFQLAYPRKKRKVAPKGHKKNDQSKPESNEHITVMACVGVQDAVVPPLVIYKGQYMLEYWFKNTDDLPRQLADITDSGWSNNVIALRWLKQAFEPATRPLCNDGREPRLLFMDGAGSHVQVEFIEACQERNIVLIILPAHMSHRFQPLDVRFFNQLKAKYHEQLEDFQIAHETSVRVTKGMFYLWHQRAWKASVASRVIRAGWRDSGLWPLSFEVMCPEDAPRPTTPEPQQAPSSIPTPTSVRTQKRYLRKVRRGEYDVKPLLEKLSKAFEVSQAELTLFKKEQKPKEEAKELHESTINQKRRGTYRFGESFDPVLEKHKAAELAARKVTEMENKEKRRKKADAKKKPAVPEST